MVDRIVVFSEIYFPRGLAKVPPKMNLASGVLCLSERVSSVKFFVSLYYLVCMVPFFFPSCSHEPLFLAAIFSYPIRWMYHTTKTQYPKTRQLTNNVFLVKLFFGRRSSKNIQFRTKSHMCKTPLCCHTFVIRVKLSKFLKKLTTSNEHSFTQQSFCG